MYATERPTRNQKQINQIFANELNILKNITEVFANKKVFYWQKTCSPSRLWLQISFLCVCACATNIGFVDFLVPLLLLFLVYCWWWSTWMIFLLLFLLFFCCVVFVNSKWNRHSLCCVFPMVWFFCCYFTDFIY